MRSYAGLPLRFGGWLALLLASLAGAATAAAPAPQDIRFPTGTHSVDLRGSVQGDAARSYRLPASTGQKLRVELQAGHGAQYFNIVSPGSNEAMFRGDIGGLRAEVLLPADGVYLIQTYLMRSAARRNELSRYTLKVSLGGDALPALPGAQDAKVPQTHFHATAPLRCQPPYGAPATTCEAGVVRRGRDGTATVEIRGPNQLFRQILFVKGRAVASNSAQTMQSRREADTHVVDFDGQERYDIPDALLTGG